MFTHAPFKRRALTAAISVLSPVLACSALAQTDSEDLSALEEVVVTAVPAGGGNPLEASVSVSSLNTEEIGYTAPRSAAEIFRALPGIRAESSGGGGNANITIRGIPLATGGSKFMQIQEDGLPVLEFGDINFGNADNYIRYDTSIERIESIRGGSASTFASNSPGGVINLLSNTGEEEGGSVGIGVGLDFDEFRTDFSYGGPLTDTLRFHVAGFFRDGEGPRDTGYNGESGGQIKANITKELDNGYFRLHFKRLDDRVATYLPSPVRVNSNGDFGAVTNYDASSEALNSPATQVISTFDSFGNPVKRDISDGIESKVNSFGFELNQELDNGLLIINKFRSSDISGGFVAPFTDTFGAYGPQSADSMAAAICDSALDGEGNAFDCSSTNVTLAGTETQYDGLAFLNLLFDTRVNDLGNLINDFNLSKSFDSGVTITGGYYYSKQNIETSWSSWPTYIQTVDGSNSQYLHITDANGAPLVNNGLWAPSFLSWEWDLAYTTSAPYFNIGFENERFNFDASVRWNNVEANGELISSCCGGNTDFDLNGDGVISGNTEDASASNGFGFGGGVLNLNRAGAAIQQVNYESDDLAFSFGGSWLINDNSTVFARYSEGQRAIADRLLQIPGALTATGGLASSTDGFDTVEQLEIGYKLQQGNLDFYATLFNTVTEDTQAEVTSGETFMREYEATGIEFESVYSFDSGFKVAGNLTWTDAEISDDAVNNAIVGNTPRRQADVIYTITPSYSTDTVNVGLSIQGSTEFYLQDNNDLKQDAYNLVHLFANWYINDSLTASLNINNLTDEFVVTESEEGSAANGDIIRARPVTGTSTTASISYRF
jgi:outer membrane receptor protein involved in Fe transport